jgi:hypothetical protein
MKCERTIGIMYSTLMVFDASVENPHNDWTDAQVRQGFVWRSSALSFGVVADSLEARVRVASDPDRLERQPDVVRSICVPFEMHASGRVVIESLQGDDISLELVAGHYALRVDQGLLASETCWIDASFERVDSPIQPEITVADAAIVVPAVFDMSGRPAK